MHKQPLEQGDQIFAFWGALFTMKSLLQLTEIAHVFGLLFSMEKDVY
jgi:hypothetical protein